MGFPLLNVQPERARSLSIVLVGLATLLVFGPSLKAALHLGFGDDRYLAVAVAPLACVLLLVWERADVFSRAAYSPRIGAPLAGVSILAGVAVVATGSAGEHAWLAMLALVLLWLSGFLWCCGLNSFRAGLYPLCCLFLMVPLPSSWMDGASRFLQHRSAVAAYGILHGVGMPVVRHGMMFSMPGLDFEVAPECSGLHSSLALILIAIVASYVFLRSGWSRAALMLLMVPLAVFKNALRIAAIGGLGARVDRAFIDGPFHHRYGGLVFSVPAVVLFVLILMGIQKLERWNRDGAGGRYRGSFSRTRHA